jgi:tetratricopeptide (TPR) repeat protein
MEEVDKTLNRQKLSKRARASGEYESALADYNTLFDLDPAHYAAERAACHQKFGHFELAINDYDLAVASNEDLYLPSRARCYEDAGDLDAALRDFQRLIQRKLPNIQKQFPSHNEADSLAKAHWQLARFYERQSDLMLAFSQFERAAQISPMFTRSLVDFCQENNMMTHYVKCLDDAVKVAPEKFLGRRAKLLESNSQLNLAFNDYNDWVIRSRPLGIKEPGYSPRAWALMKRAQFHKRQGNFYLAKRDLFVAKFYEMVQRLLGFSSWPEDI